MREEREKALLFQKLLQGMSEREGEDWGLAFISESEKKM